FRSAQGYIARLINSGHKVAICDQIEDSPKSRNVSAKALVKREVVRIITPGMIVDNNFLNEKSNNYILAIFQNKNTSGLSYLDISTGTFRVSESEDINLIIDETLRVSPSEILFPESFKTDPFFSPFLKAVPEKTVTFLDNTAFDYNRGKDRLAEQLKPISLQVFGCKDLKAGISAAGAILFYVGETQKQKIEHLSKIEPYTLNNYLLIDNLSCRNLELLRNLQTGSRQGSLLGTIDKTITAMGGRLLKRWLRYPLLDIEQIHARLDAVDDAKEKIDIRSRIRQSLKSVSDLERLNSRIAMGHSNARDLIALKSSLYVLPEIRSALSRLKAALFTWNENTVSLNELAELIEKAIREDPPPTISEGNIIKEGYNKKLDELISISRDGKNWLVKFEAKEKEKTGINTLKVRYNKVFGYYIEVSKAQSKNVPPNYIRKQTLVNAERYITDELKNFEKNVLTAEDEKAILEYKIFNNIRKEVVKNNNLIKNVAEFLAELDCLLNLAEIADLNNYKRPEINASGRIFIEDGRHPVVEKMITGERFVPNTIKMDNTKNQILIITGPNMAGKSTVLRQVAILVLMAQMGSFVPARRALISITDKIFTRVGALDNLSQGESTFMVEMKETANILNNSTAQSLVVMDEIGRGTSTFDGISIAWAVAECLHDLNDRGVKT
ncbi:MAG TPA: DNA mismatch repair protein MutS, partial [Desulfobacteraceae bacterium]|nr:DNA mismatch repair protein MutS [Desulfobacteraceae bacterium]